MRMIMGKRCGCERGDEDAEARYIYKREGIPSQGIHELVVAKSSSNTKHEASSTIEKSPSRSKDTDKQPEEREKGEKKADHQTTHIGAGQRR